jgi:hypothetical protein
MLVTEGVFVSFLVTTHTVGWKKPITNSSRKTVPTNVRSDEVGFVDGVVATDLGQH